MPVDSKGKFYPAQERWEEAEVVRIVSSTGAFHAGALSDFSAENAEALTASLHIGSHLVVDPTGANNVIHVVGVTTASETDVKVAIAAPSGSTTTVTTTNDVQTITITGTPTGGTFTLTFDGQTTGNIAYNATASAVQTALEALSNLAPGDITVAGGPFPGTPVTVEFSGTSFAKRDQPLMTTADSFTGGTAPASAVASEMTVTVNPKTGETALEAVKFINRDPYASKLIYAGNADSGAGTLAAVAAASLVAGPAGSSPTLDLKLQHSGDGTNWYDVGNAWAQKNARGDDIKGFVVPGEGTLRWYATIGGSSSPAFGVRLGVTKRTYAA